MKKIFSINAATQILLRKKALVWANSFSHFSYFTHNQIIYPESGFLEILGVGLARQIKFSTEQTCWETLAEAHRNTWLMGYLGYDLKNEIEDLQSINPDHKQWPTAFFYEPIHLICFTGNTLEISAANPDEIWEAINRQEIVESQTPTTVDWQAQTTRERYIETVEQLRQHIIEGDIYEINYCMEFVAKAEILSPLAIFEQLNTLSPMPFAALHKQANKWIISASPERFLKKTGSKLLSQPIKGTAPRGKTPAQDELHKTTLLSSEKERAENLMIVDLVRNDLARNAVVGSTHVPELFGIYSFQYVHQMISSVAATLHPNRKWTDALRDAFPMGSMTGAPKIRAMQLIEQYEDTRRSVYAGAMGYVTPEADFDFNVVIRSLFMDTDTQQMSFQVGSAITFDADAATEYEECLLKAAAIFKLFGAYK